MCIANIEASEAQQLEVAPSDNWRDSIEAAPAGSTIIFLQGVYEGCDIVLSAGLVCVCVHACARVSARFVCVCACVI